MKNIQLFSTILFCAMLSSCAIIGSIFKTGMGVGIFIAIAVVVLIVIVISKIGKNKE